MMVIGIRFAVHLLHRVVLDNVCRRANTHQSGNVNLRLNFNQTTAIFKQN